MVVMLNTSSSLNIEIIIIILLPLQCSKVKYVPDRIYSNPSFMPLTLNRGPNGPVNVHLLSWPSLSYKL